MPNKNLQKYLNDHLSGAQVALALLAQWRKREIKPEWKRMVSSLHEDIQEDHETLREFVAELGLTESLPRKLGGKVAGRMAQLRNQVLAPSDSDRLFLESLELVLCGIFGKRALWKVLSLPDVATTLNAATVKQLISRAERQIERLEVVRLELAKKSLTVNRADASGAFSTAPSGP